MCLSPFIDVTVGWEVEEYTVEEGPTVRIGVFLSACFVVSGIHERDISVNLTTANSATATG